MNGQQQPQKPVSVPPGTNLSQVIRTKDPVDSHTRQWQLSSFDIVEEMRHRLNGEMPTIDSTGASISWKQEAEPWANDRGVNELCAIISFYLNKNMHLSWFSEEQISKIMKDFECVMIRKFVMDYDRMEIRKEDVEQVFVMIVNTVWAAINRARYGGEKQFLESTEQRTILSNEAAEKKNTSFFDNLPVLGRK